MENIFQIVKENVSPMDAAQYYGVQVNHKGKGLCPFHNDHHPSMMVDEKKGGGFYCYACQEKGDVISFVGKLFGLGNYEAAKKLAEDFQIPFEKSKTWSPPFSDFALKKKKEREYQIRKRELCLKAHSLFSLMNDVKLLCESEAMKLLMGSEDYTWVLDHWEQINNTIDFLTFQKDDEIQEEIEKIEREVDKNAEEFHKICGRSQRAS